MIQSLEVSSIKVKTLTREIIALAQRLGFKAVPEYRTPDGTRIDMAILNDGQKLLAIELEASFKWFPQRVLYDVIKAHRAGFPELWIITPFRASPGWVEGYAEELGLKMEIKSDRAIIDELKARLARL